MTDPAPGPEPADKTTAKTGPETTRKTLAEHRRASWLIAGFAGAWTGVLLFYPIVLVLALGDGDLEVGWPLAVQGGMVSILLPGIIHVIMGPVPVWAVMAFWLGRQGDADVGAAPATLPIFCMAIAALVLAQVLVVGVQDVARVATSPQMLANIAVLAVMFVTYRLRRPV